MKWRFYVMSKEKEFLEQLTKRIERLEDHLNNEIESFAEGLKNPENIDTHFGLAKYAEKITVIKAQIDVLKEQKQIFEFLINQD
jgi:hypothetical protein